MAGKRTVNRGRKTTVRSITNKRINRAVRIARTAPLARVRARPTIKGQAISAASINGFRRMTIFPKKLPKDGKDDPWWIEGLKWIGISVMKLLITALSADTLERHLTRYPLPIEHPLYGRFLEATVPTGSITMLAFDYSALLAETDFVRQIKDGPLATCHYRQAKLEWVKVTIHPVSHPNNRGGMIAAALTPISDKQFKDDFSVKKTEARDFNELLKTPGIVYKSALSPTALSYSPRPSDSSYQWGVFGVQNAKEAPLSAQFYLHIGYTNLSSDSSTITEMALEHSMFDISIESRIHLREYDEDVTCQLNPQMLVNNGKATVTSNQTKCSVSLNEFYEHHGLLLREVDISSMEYSP